MHCAALSESLLSTPAFDGSPSSLGYRYQFSSCSRPSWLLGWQSFGVNGQLMFVQSSCLSRPLDRFSSTRIEPFLVYQGGFAPSICRIDLLFFGQPCQT